MADAWKSNLYWTMGAQCRHAAADAHCVQLLYMSQQEFLVCNW